MDNLTQEEQFEFLRKNKDKLIESKKASIKFTDTIASPPLTIKPKEVEQLVKTKGEVPSEEAASPETLDVTVVCNTANWCDSHMDVLTDDAYTNSIKLRGTTIPHIADHEHESTAHVGDVKAVYTQKLAIRELGFDKEGTTTALLMDTTIRKDYNEDVFKFYLNGKINQHSIGLSYVSIALALNSKLEEDKAEYEVWQSYAEKVINQEVIQKKGYFWLVSEVDVRENSCVLFGANSLTPTLTIAKEETPFVGVKTKSDNPNPNPNPTGETTMNLEQALVKLAEAQSELEALKTSTSLESVKAKNAETARILGILEAQKTFALPLDSAIANIKSGATVDQSVTMFETIKQQVQMISGIDTTLGVQSTVKTADSVFTPMQANPFDPAAIEKAFEQLSVKQENQLFKGVI